MSAAAVASRSSVSRSSRPLRPPSASWVQPGDRLRLQHRERREQPLLVDAAPGGGDGAVGADDRRSGGQQVGGIAGRLTELRAGGRPFEAGDDDMPVVVQEEVAAVDATVGDVRGAQTCELAPRVVEHRSR